MRASGTHLVFSIIVAAMAALLVFKLWYPYPYREISGGRELFTLMIIVDIIMGPLITAIIFNQAKPRRELVMDLTLVILLQLAALGYGLWTVYMARPVHLVFEYTRLTVIHSADVAPNSLIHAPAELQTLPTTGPTAIGLRPFKDSKEQYEATMSALGGVPIAGRTDLWQSYDKSRASILLASKPASELKARFPKKEVELEKSIKETGRALTDLRYLPVVSRSIAWTALLDSVTADIVGFLPLDSF